MPSVAVTVWPSGSVATTVPLPSVITRVRALAWVSVVHSASESFSSSSAFASVQRWPSGSSNSTMYVPAGSPSKR